MTMECPLKSSHKNDPINLPMLDTLYLTNNKTREKYRVSVEAIQKGMQVNKNITNRKFKVSIYKTYACYC
ncbi:hypothetical protein KFK09_000700 [Dendrobium nobile]|uniref:Uncharacterized protein n=1 Tax=Dendrobium nobile TaxID=94219 RepID=A0A8T3C9B6_DENNO|nr:hypothetical protein KFK09_000700 [Dendrobium nobile]